MIQHVQNMIQYLHFDIAKDDPAKTDDEDV